MPLPRDRGRASLALIAGRYELVRELTTQGDSVDWEGFDSALQRRVIVRMLHPRLAGDRAAVDRFWQAARSAARSKDDTGERILDGGNEVESGRPFVVREWPSRPSPSAVEGATIPLPVRDRLGERAQFGARRVALLGLVLVAVLGVLALRSGLEGWLAWVNEPLGPLGQVSRGFLQPRVPTPPAVGARPGEATPTPGGPPPTVAAGAQARSPSSSVATPTATPGPASRATPTLDVGSGVARRIVNTDGQGVALRASPGGDRLPGRGYDEGATVTAFESSGPWTRIRGSDGREGWVLSVTLAP